MDTNKELIEQVTVKAKTWLTDGYDAETQAEVRRMLEADDKTDLIESFYKDLEFGTGGLRGIMGAGSNRMNIYTVTRATQGLANYIRKQGGAEKGVAIAFDSRNMSAECSGLTLTKRWGRTVLSISLPTHTARIRTYRKGL